VDSCGVARIIPGNGENIFPTIRSTIDGWELPGMSDEDFADMLFGESDDDWQPDEKTATGLRNETAKERARNNGTTDNEESERLANLERYASRGYAFERPIGDDKFDDFDTREQCEESYRFDDCGNEV
jgi:hypothetical protein